MMLFFPSKRYGIDGFYTSGYFIVVFLVDASLL